MDHNPLGVSLPLEGAAAHQRYLPWHWVPTSKRESTAIFPTASYSMCLRYFFSSALAPHFSEHISSPVSSCVSSSHGCTCFWTLLNSSTWCSPSWLQCWCPPPLHWIILFFQFSHHNFRKFEVYYILCHLLHFSGPCTVSSFHPLTYLSKTFTVFSRDSPMPGRAENCSTWLSHIYELS